MASSELEKKPEHAAGVVFTASLLEVTVELVLLLVKEGMELQPFLERENRWGA